MQPKRVFIFGQGQLGTFYKFRFNESGAEAVSPRLDIRDLSAVRQAARSASPDLIINCAAKTDIDWCELHREETFAINTLGADNIAAAAAENGIYLVHISSGCVQESLSADDAKSEDDPPHPLSYYSWTKVWAENLLFERAARCGLKALVLRPRQLLSSMVSPRNALVKMLTYGKFIDTPNSCTIVEDLMRVTEKLVAADAVGLYNVVNPGVTTPYRIAEMLRERIKPEMRFVKISKAELNSMTLAKRIDAVLSTRRLAESGIVLRPVEERLFEVIDSLKQNLAASGATAVLEKTAAETEAKLAVHRQLS